MKRLYIILSVFIAMLLNIPMISSKAAVQAPAIKITIQKYSNSLTGIIEPTALPENSHIIIAKYINNRCAEVEVREYRSKAEEFNLADEIDTVKVMAWEGMSNLKPVLKAEVIDVNARQRIEEIAAKLKKGKNKNVTIYTTEENEPRAVIWTKGIVPPQMSEFEKEVDITDSSYTFLYAGQDKGSGWYDVNKSLPQEDGADRNMCYAAVSANQLHWWLDQNKDNIDAYLNSLDKGEITDEKKSKLEQLQELRNGYEGQSKSRIYNLFRQYFESPYYAYNADLLNDFFINGYQVNTAGKVNTPNFFKWDPRGGFFYDVFEKNNLTMRYSAGDYTVFKRDIIFYMKEGQSIGIIHATPTNGVTHIITLWGVEVDHNNEITALFVTDSDDYEQPEIGMKRMLLKKNSSGYPIITTNINNNNTGAKILEFVPLSLGEEYWEAMR